MSSDSAPKEWRLEVRQIADADDSGKRVTNFRPGDEESTIVVIDRDTGDAVGPVPSPAEIEALFKAVDDAYNAQVSQGDESADLSAKAVKLAQSLKSDLGAAEAAGDEDSLREALQRLRDVELPNREKVTQQLGKLQLVNAAAAGDIQALHSAMCFARCHGLEDMSEYATAKTEHARLRRDQLRERTLSIVRADNPDVAAIVSAVDIAQRRGWDDIAQEALKALVAGTEHTENAEGLAKLLKVHRMASDQGIHAVLQHTEQGLKQCLERARKSKDAHVLCNLMKAAEAEGLKIFTDAVQVAITDLTNDWKKKVTDTGEEAAKAALRELLSAAKACQLPSVKDSVSRAIEQCARAEKDLKMHTKQMVKSDNAKQIIDAAEIAKQRAWNDVMADIFKTWQIMIVMTAEKQKLEAVAELLEMHSDASESKVEDLAALTATAIVDAIDSAHAAGEVVNMMLMAQVLESSGGHEFAGHARKKLQDMVEALKESTSDDALDTLERLRGEATSTGDSSTLELADGAIGAAAERAEQRRNSMQSALDSSTDGVAVLNLMCEASAKGFSDVADRAKVKLMARMKELFGKGGDECMQEAAKTHKAAQKVRAREVVQITSASFDARIGDAQRVEDVALLLVVAHAAEAEGSNDIASKARKAIRSILDVWRQVGSRGVPAGVKACRDAAKKRRDKEIEEFASALLDLASRCLQRCGDVQQIAEVVRDARKHNFPGILREAQEQLQKIVDRLKDELNFEALRSLRDDVNKCGATDIAKNIGDCVDLADRLEVAKAAQDVHSIIDIILNADSVHCSGLGKDGRSFLCGVVDEMRKGAKGGDRHKTLQEIYAAARLAGLEDVADEALDAVGGALPADWTLRAKDGKHGSLLLSKVPIQDAGVIDRIQQMVDATFQGWGFLGVDCCTRDRHKFQHPLGSRLKIEEVIHVENTENFLNYITRRDEVAAQVRALPAGTMDGDCHGAHRADWHVKTRQVSLKGIWRHSEEPVDKDINECWLWHGTSEAGVQGITDTDFDMGRAGACVGSMFGAGLYFAESCLKADEYAQADARGWCPLLMCRVVLGRVKYCDDKSPWTIASELEDSCKSGGGFHSVLGDREAVRGTFREFIVFDNDQVYPEYIVWYSRQPPFKVTYP